MGRPTRDQAIYVAGHRGMVGSAIVRRLTELGYGNLIVRTRDELDLLDPRAVHRFFAENRVDQVYLAAAKARPPRVCLVGASPSSRCVPRSNDRDVGVAPTRSKWQAPQEPPRRNEPQLARLERQQG